MADSESEYVDFDEFSPTKDYGDGCSIHCTDAHGELTELSKSSTWDTLKHAALIRNHPVAELNDKNEMPQIRYHRKCYQVFTMKRDLDKIQKTLAAKLKHVEFANISNSSDPDLRVKRQPQQGSSRSTSLLPDECIFCRRKNKYRSKKLEKLVKCVEDRAVSSIKSSADQSDNFYVKGLLSTQDLIACEAQYHITCYKSFTKPYKASDDDVDQYKEVEIMAIKEVIKQCNDLSLKPKVLPFQTLLKNIQQSMLSKHVIMKESTRKFLQRYLEKQCHDIHFVNVQGKVYLYPNSLKIDEVIKENICLTNELNKLRETSEVQNGPQAINVCAKFLKKDIDQLTDTLPWPPRPEDLTPDKFKIPDGLHQFLSILIKDGRTNSKRASILRYSFGQDLVYAITEGRVKTPKSILLPSMVKSLTNNTELINILNRLGHGVSYSILMESQTENAYQIYEQHQVNNCIIPRDCQKEAFTIFVADNIDRNEETVSGYGTTHKVNSLIIQKDTGNFGDIDSISSPKQKRSRRSFKPVINEVNVIRFSSKKRIGPSKLTFPETSEKALLFAEMEHDNFLWSFLRYNHAPSQIIPSWTGFHIIIQGGVPILKSKIRYLDCIDAPATDIHTIYQVMCRALTIIQSLHLNAIVCVFDQAIYSKACEIKWKEPEKFQNCIVMMGIFHLLMVYMGILNKRFGDGGLRDALIQSSIVAEGSIDSALRGKSYNRGIRIYKIFYEALNRLLISKVQERATGSFEELLQEISSANSINKQALLDLKDKNSFQDLYNKYSVLKDELHSSEMALPRFWISYIQMVDLLLATIYSVRSGNWNLLLECIHLIIPFAFAYDNINYARYLTAMLGEMLSLESHFPEIYKEFQAGNFAAQLSDHKAFSRCETDKVIEMTLNKDTKTPGGTTGFSTNINAVRRWEINASYRADLRNCFHEHFNYESQQYPHKDLSPSRILKDEEDVAAVLSVLTETFIHPFSEQPLVSISTGIEVPRALSDEILNAENIGTDAMKAFMSERLGIEPVKSFFDPIKKIKLASFSNLNKTKTCKTKDKVFSLKMSKDLFAKVAIIAQKRSVDLKALFRYPLGPLPLALAEMDGSLKKTVKSSLFHKLEGSNSFSDDYPVNYAIIVDGMAAVRQMKVTKLTYKEFAKKLLGCVISSGKMATRIDVVFDVYLDNSIKDVERNRRSHGELSVQQIVPSAEIKQWNLLLSSNQNKNKLTEFIVTEWKSLGHLLEDKILFVTCSRDVYQISRNETTLVQDLQSNHQEADTRMLLHAHHASLTHNRIIISSPDTDVFMLLLSKVCDLDTEVYMMTGTAQNRRLININAVANDIYGNINKTNCTKKSLVKALLGFHCFTGCDTISAFAGRGKLKPLSLLVGNEDYIDVFCSLGEELSLTNEMIRKLERFVIHMYGKKPTSQTLSIDDIRYSLYCQRGGKTSFAHLPPCLNVLTQHCIRANYQTFIWRQCFTPIIDLDVPNNHGWCMNEGKLDIQWMTCNPAPEEVLELVSCSCKRICDQSCLCVQNDFACTDACHCDNCSNDNHEVLESEYDTEDDSTDED